MTLSRVPCPEHDVPMLPSDQVRAFATLLRWPRYYVLHACEARFEVTKKRPRD